MNRRLLFQTLLMALLLGAFNLLPGQNKLSGRRAPGFSLPDMHFRQYDLQDFRGKYVLIDFMQTQCPHCRKFSQILEKAQQKYGERIQVLSIVNPPSNQSMVRRYVEELNISTPILFDCGQVAASYFRATPENPAINIPHLFIIDPEGNIIEDYPYNALTREIFEGEGLFEILDRLLKAKSR